MPCCEEGKPKSRSAGCGCGGARPFPWFSALCDPAMVRLFFRRFGMDLFRGAVAGSLAAGAALASGDRLGEAGLALGGVWFHFHAAAVVAAIVPAGMILGALVPGNGMGGWWRGAKAALPVLALGGLLNGFLEGGLAFRAPETVTSVAAFLLLGAPALALALGFLLATTRRGISAGAP